MSSSAGQYTFAPITASVNTLSDDKTTRSYVSGIFFEEENWLILTSETPNSSTQAEEIGQAAAMTKQSTNQN